MRSRKAPITGNTGQVWRILDTSRAGKGFGIEANVVFLRRVKKNCEMV